MNRDGVKLTFGGRKFHKAGVMAEKVQILGTANVSSVTGGTHSMPSVPNLMGQVNIISLSSGEKELNTT